MYFGAGSFYNIQHELVEAEKRILGRKDKELSSLAGYAGGTKVGADVKNPVIQRSPVCFYNVKVSEEYGKLGHSQAVGLKIPRGQFSNFASEYFKLINDGAEQDPEFRNIVGIPGGMKSSLFSYLKSQTPKDFELKEGKGDDSNGNKIIWVYDSDKFPFYQAELSQ